LARGEPTHLPLIRVELLLIDTSAWVSFPLAHIVLFKLSTRQPTDIELYLQAPGTAYSLGMSYYVGLRERWVLEIRRQGFQLSLAV
jgi:hypothetical protein